MRAALIARAARRRAPGHRRGGRRRRATTASRTSSPRRRRQPPLLVVLDGIEDPHNVGAILRTADAAGVHGVVRQARHAASLDGVVAKASAGALAHVRIATVVNIARAIEELKDAGVWTVGLAGDAPERYDARRSDAADGDRARRRRHGAAAAGAGALRSAGVDPDARGGRQPECVGRGGGDVVRGGTSARVRAS